MIRFTGLHDHKLSILKLDEPVPESPAILFTTVSDLLKQPDIKLDLLCPLLNQVNKLMIFCYDLQMTLLIQSSDLSKDISSIMD